MIGVDFMRAYHEQGDAAAPCCVFVAELYNRVCEWRDGTPIPRGSDRWKQAMITDPAEPWSVLHAYERAQVDAEAFEVGGAYLCQGWRNLRKNGRVGPESSGHTWLWLPSHQHIGLRVHNSERGGRRSEIADWRELHKRYDDVGIVQL